MDDARLGGWPPSELRPPRLIRRDEPRLGAGSYFDSMSAPKRISGQEQRTRSHPSVPAEDLLVASAGAPTLDVARLRADLDALLGPK